ncbi:TolC family protein [Parasphingorhabdus sp.]|uniref:TolC family protein n=1 Tax=Parasphingorhabdus sp. TaxID=2709688 RepID=UPI003D2733B1
MKWKTARMRLLVAAIFAASSGSNLFAQPNEVSLEEALRLAGAESPTIDASQAEVDAARGNERQEGLRLNPEISVEAENIAGTGVFKGLRSTEMTVAVGQRLELGGKRGARKRAAAAATNVAEIEARITRAELAAEVRAAFTDAVAAQNRLELASRVVERNRELARIAGILVEVGRDPPLRAIRAQAALGEAEAALQAADTDAYAARLTLASLWGGQSPPARVQEFWLSEVDLIDFDPAQALPVQLAAANANAAEAIIKRERANAVPDVTVSGGFRRFEESNDTAFVVGASIAIPLWNRNQGNVDIARAKRRSAEARRLLQMLAVNRQFEIAKSRLGAATVRVQTLQNETLPQAEEALRLARLGYRYGKFNLIDVLDAAAARDSTENSLIEAKLSLAEAVTTLLRLGAE